MSKAEILAELPRLTPDERDEIQSKLDELAAEAWRKNRGAQPSVIENVDHGPVPNRSA